ncbi:hypothetical protein MIZ03_1107 [Rhodoferax lithotrophicus]|uniref:Uncharacterized protein n=1 Tax=Rhodoferax lithotrophicus TaxID=2798804 RepID=A0ABM7MJ79_9BURK|nr:hypothetical protein [Rhodoferax sp. MIZ03]BCO26227.1 hypothetical protein MIZ03_1107 [Rhodoferax sp. MIZ03]
MLILLVIPSVFTLMDDFEHFMGRVKRWVRREKAPEEKTDLQAI